MSADDLAVAALALARRFSSGATMWCTSLHWPDQARRLAIAFSHPVVVGQTALPAVHVDHDDLVRTLRVLAQPGDVVVAVGAAGDLSIASLLRRVEPWGVTGVWIGAGPRPEIGAADYVLWVDGVEPAVAARSGAFVVLYNLLLESTQTALQHPEHLKPDELCTDDVCITCSDEGTLAEVVTILDTGQAVVRAAGRTETIDVSLVDEPEPGALVVVHAGIAITVVEDDE